MFLFQVGARFEQNLKDIPEHVTLDHRKKDLLRGSFRILATKPRRSGQPCQERCALRNRFSHSHSFHKLAHHQSIPRNLVDWTRGSTLTHTRSLPRRGGSVIQSGEVLFRVSCPTAPYIDICGGVWIESVKKLSWS